MCLIGFCLLSFFFFKQKTAYEMSIGDWSSDVCSSDLWTREADSRARDGVPAHAFPAAAGREPGPLPQRDFDLDRSWGLLPSGGPPAPVTALLVTAGDHQKEWLRAGQGLQRLLLRAASHWVFASLQTQPMQE